MTDKTAECDELYVDPREDPDATDGGVIGSVFRVQNIAEQKAPRVDSDVQGATYDRFANANDPRTTNDL